MARNTSISLGDHFMEFVDAQVASGRYGSTSEVVRAGLRLLETQEYQVQALQEALKAGEDSGAAVPFDVESFLERMRATHAR
jgi:antitoxin ParD1/3/4